MKCSFPTRTAILCTLYIVLCSSNVFAKLVYVNVNNPTPGTGTSWATAFNDLNAAFAACEPDWGDTIWVAEGTYKPTTTNDRTVAFTPTWYAKTFGGFAGTETSFSQRDWKNHPTILSGDIGIQGDASDNSYHVVEFYCKNSGGDEFDGFIIQDGNANQGYPAAITPGEYNQGGGLFVYGNVITYKTSTAAELKNCVIRNNRAVYGAGVSFYVISGNTSSYTILRSCEVVNNTSLLDGAGYYFNSAHGETVRTELYNCIFNNNVSSTGLASGIACATDGTSGTYTAWMYYCTFYNNAAPVFNSVVTSGVTPDIEFWYNIIWNASIYPDGTFTNVNGIKYAFSDIDMATVPSSNVNYDPQFVDAANGNFRLSPCSPAIDVTTISPPSYTYDYDGNARIQGSKGDFGAYESAKTVGVAPTVSNAYPNYCQSSNVNSTNDLSTLITSTYTGLTWYDAAQIQLAAEPTVSTAITGTTSYYVSQATATTCPGNKTRIYVTIVAAPSTPADQSLQYCEGATPAAWSTLITKDAALNTLVWYSAASGGAVLSSTPVIATTPSPQTESFYVSQKNSTCESGIGTITVTVGKPDAPVTNDANPNYCQGATASQLDIAGTDLKWYSDASGGLATVYAVVPTPATSSAGAQYYYISQTVNGCESDRTLITVSINATPGAPVGASLVSYCQDAVSSALVVTSASGATLQWYANATGGMASTVTPIPATHVAGTQNFYVSQVLFTCVGPRTKIEVDVHAKPAAPTVSQASYTYCQGMPATALSASGSSLHWFDNGGNVVGASPVPSTAVAGTAYYYVSQTVSGCESDRSAIVIQVQTQLPPPVATDIAYCQKQTTIALSATGTSLLWYTNSSGGTGNAIAPVPGTAVSGNTTYYVSQSYNGTCESDRAALVVTVYALPAITASVPVTSACPGAYIQLTATGAVAYEWSPAVNLSNAMIANPVALLTDNTSYMVTGTDANGCSNTAVAALVMGDGCDAFPVPTAFTPNGDGHNDVFRILSYSTPVSYSMQIFNRFGDRVFSSNNISNGWDGNYKQHLADVGAYVYIITITNRENKTITKKGTIVLMR